MLKGLIEAADAEGLKLAPFIGIACPGVIDADGSIEKGAQNLPGNWESSKFNLPASLAEAIPMIGDHDTAVLMHNDGVAQGLSEVPFMQDVERWGVLTIGTGLGMGLVLGGKLHRGAHGAAGEIGYMPFSEGHGADLEDARQRGSFEAASTAAAVVRAATRAGVRDASSAQQVFSAAEHGDTAAAAVVAEEALLVAKAVCAVITVVDPDLVVLGGGIGQAPGFMAAVQVNLATMAPVLPTVKTSALGADAVVQGCVAAGLDRAWELVIAGIPAPPSE